MSPELATSTKRLAGLQKAAILLVTLGQETSAKILKHVSEEEAELLADAIARLDHVTREDSDAVLNEFSAQMGGTDFLRRGGLDYAREVLANAYGSETATRLVDRLVKSLEQDGGDFRNLGKVDPRQLARFIQDEHPQTIAVIVSNLDASQAASLLRSLPAEIRADIAIRMATLDQISPEILRNISTVVRRKLGNLGELSRESCGGVRATANMLNRLDSTTGAQLLEAMEKLDVGLSESVRRLMFVFSDLKALDTTALQEVIAKVDRKTLTTALKGADAFLVDKIAQCLSGRAAEMLREDIAAIGSIKAKDLDAAQQEVIKVVRQLEREGVISLTESSEDASGA